MGRRVGGLVVNELAFDSNDLSSNRFLWKMFD